MTVLQYLKKEVANKRGDLLTFFQDFKSVELAAKGTRIEHHMLPISNKNLYYSASRSRACRDALSEKGDG